MAEASERIDQLRREEGGGMMATPLSSDHLKMLIDGSGIAPEIIAERGYRTSTGYSELKSCGITVSRDTDVYGLLLPLDSVEGKPGMAYCSRKIAPYPS